MPAPSHAPTVVIENFYPCLEGGRHPIKRIAGEPLDVWCDIFMDGHVVMSAVLKWKLAGTKRWFETPMSAADGDRSRDDTYGSAAHHAGGADGRDR